VQRSGATVTVYGTSGNDEVALDPAAADTLSVKGIGYYIDPGQLGTLVFEAGAGADALKITGSAGNETLTLGDAAGTIAGAFNIVLNYPGVEQLAWVDHGGSDTYRIAMSRAEIALEDTAGIDTLDFSSASAGIDLDLSASAGQVQTRGAGASTLALTGVFENVVGTSFDDKILGSDVANALHGGLGNDVLAGAGGDDRLFGGANGRDDQTDGSHYPRFGSVLGDSLVGGGGNDLLLGDDVGSPNAPRKPLQIRPAVVDDTEATGRGGRIGRVPTDEVHAAIQ